MECFDFEQNPWVCPAVGVRGRPSDPGAPPLLLSLLGKVCLDSLLPSGQQSIPESSILTALPIFALH